MQVTLYFKPNATKEIVDITNIDPMDEEYFTKHNIQLSMEQILDNICVYAKYGPNDEDEILTFSNNQDCISTLTKVRQRLEQIICP